MKLRPMLMLLALLASSAAGFAQQDNPAIRRQNSDSGTLEIAPQVNPRQPPNAAALPQASEEPPSEPVLVIPQASREFVGRWGGHLSLARSSGRLAAPPDAIVSLLFGERGGNVFLRTTVFGGRDSNILKTGADVMGPRDVTLKVEGLEISHRPPIRHVEKLRLSLNDAGALDVVKSVSLYVTGDSEPFAEADYRGTLHQLTSAEERELDREVTERGEVPQATIRERRPVYGP